jgi:hypothetical protein
VPDLHRLRLGQSRRLPAHRRWSAGGGDHTRAWAPSVGIVRHGGQHFGGQVVRAAQVARLAPQ